MATGTVRFILHTQEDKKHRSKGKRPINLIYSLHGERKFFRTTAKLYKENWNQPQQRAVYLDKKQAKMEAPTRDFDLMLSSREADQMNTYLNSLRKQILDIECRFEMDTLIYTSEDVIQKIREANSKLLKTKREVKSDVILNYIEKWIENHSSTRAIGSMTVYRSLKAHLSVMVAEKKINITFENIDFQFMQAFQNFLVERRGLSNVTIAKQIQVLKTFLGYARKDGFRVSENYKDFSMKQESQEVIALTQEEFQALWDLDLSDNKKYERVRDFFLLGCVTGLRYSDLAQLKREHIFRDEIRLTVHKTKEILTIPLNAYSHAILNKYKHMLSPIPVIKNQKTNEYLTGYTKKEKSGKITKQVGIAEMAGITTPTEIVRHYGAKRVVNVYPKYELVTCHVARKTYISLSLEKGIQAEVVMSLSGHKSYNSFKRYVSISGTKKQAVVQQAWGEIPKDELKAV